MADLAASATIDLSPARTGNGLGFFSDMLTNSAMRWLIPVFAIACVATIVVNGQQKSPQPTTEAQHPNNTTKPDVQSTTPPKAVIQKPAPNDQQNGAAHYSQDYLYRLLAPEILPNIGLLIAAILGFVVAIRTLNHMRESSERQLRAYVLQEQSGILDGTMLDPPQPARPLTAPEIADIASGVQAIYVHGRIEYRDAFAKQRFTNFRVRYNGPYPPFPNAIFNFSESGNDAN